MPIKWNPDWLQKLDFSSKPIFTWAQYKDTEYVQCLICPAPGKVKYSNSGWSSLLDHSKSHKHLRAQNSISNQYLLPQQAAPSSLSPSTSASTASTRIDVRHTHPQRMEVSRHHISGGSCTFRQGERIAAEQRKQTPASTTSGRNVRIMQHPSHLIQAPSIPMQQPLHLMFHSWVFDERGL